MEYSYRFRIYPNRVQENLIQRTFGCSRFVYNHYLAKRKELYEKEKKTFSFYACCADLTGLKEELEWLREVDSTALQSSIRDLDTAFQNFFRRVRQGGVPGYPCFKSKRDHRKSYKAKNVGNTIRIEGKHIRLPKLGLVKCRVSKEVKGRILSGTVSQSPSGKYFVSLCCTDVPKLETIFPRDCDDVILDSPTSLFQGKRPVFPALSEFGRGFLGSASVFAPVKEGLVAPVETFNDILRGLRSKLIPILVYRQPLQLCQMRLHTISGNVFPIDSIVSLLQCKEMIPDLTCDFYHVVEMPGSIRDIELV